MLILSPQFRVKLGLHANAVSETAYIIVTLHRNTYNKLITVAAFFTSRIGYRADWSESSYTPAAETSVWNKTDN
jgi:hypothetical protein